MKNKIVLLGAGGQAKIVLDLLEKSKQYDVQAVLDDNQLLHSKRLLNSTILGNLELLRQYDKQEVGFIVCLADNKKRKEIFNQYVDLGYEPLNVIAETSNISNFAKLGKGNAIADFCNIHPDVVLGDNIIIGPMSSIAHDCIIESHVHLSSGCRLAGNVTVKEFAELGTAVSCIPSTIIGKNCILGAGAVVVKDIEDNSLAVGVPAKIIKKIH